MKFVNLDSMWLANLADDFRGDDDEIAARLLRIAEHLQSLDNRVAALGNGYEQGVRDATARMRARSNILSENPEADAEGEAILEQLTSIKVKHIPMGVRALDDRPHEFNAPVKKKAKPTIDLDLSFLEEL